jgi:hypothetical protein
MVNVQNLEAVTQYSKEKFIRIADEWDTADAQTLKNFMGAFGPIPDTDYYRSQALFKRTVDTRIVS